MVLPIIHPTSHVRLKSKIEQYRLGYPRLAAFLNLDPGLTIIRRFDQLHLRVLLEQQTELNELEDRLNKCDDAETVQFNLSSCLKDGNLERRRMIEEIKIKLREYDKSVRDYSGMLQLANAEIQHQQHVKNWMDGNKPIVRSESAWVSQLLHSEDFIALKSDDSGKAGLENLLERALKKWPHVFAKMSSSAGKTDDENITLFRPATLRWIVRICMSILVPLWTILPGILIFTTSHKASKAVIYSLFMISTSLAMCFTTTTTNYSMVIAIVSYGAVLSTFLS